MSLAKGNIITTTVIELMDTLMNTEYYIVMFRYILHICS